MFIKKDSNTGLLFYRELQIVTDGLIVYLDTENVSSYSGTGSTWNDLTTYNNDGTLNNGVSFVTTQYNQKVFNFDGINDYVELPPNFFSQNSNDPFSLSVWFRSNGGYGTILGQQNDRPPGNATGWVEAIYFDNTGRVRTSCFWGNNTNPPQTTNVLNDNNWHNITVTYESNSRKTYVDGILDNTWSVSQYSYPGTYYYFLGAGKSSGWTSSVADYFSGSISHFLFYNKKLTDSEVLQNYNVLSKRYIGRITGYISGSSTFITPTFTDSFEFQGNWNDTVDLTTSLSGTTTFTSPDFTDSFEFQGNWNDSIDITTVLSGNTTFTVPDFTDSFEFQGNWNDAIDITTALSGTTTFTSPDLTDSFETGSGGW